MFLLDYAIVSQIQVLQTEQKIPLIFKNQQLYGNRVKREYNGEKVWRCHREVRWGPGLCPQGWGGQEQRNRGEFPLPLETGALDWATSETEERVIHQQAEEGTIRYCSSDDSQWQLTCWSLQRPSPIILRSRFRRVSWAQRVSSYSVPRSCNSTPNLAATEGNSPH